MDANYTNNQKTINKKAVPTYLSKITLNVGGLNAPIKRHRVTERIKKKKRPVQMLPIRDPFQIERSAQTASKGTGKDT